MYMTGPSTTVVRQHHAPWGAVAIAGLVWIGAFAALLMALPSHSDQLIANAQNLSLDGWDDETHLDVESVPDELFAKPELQLLVNVETGAIRQRGDFDQLAAARATAESHAREDSVSWQVQAVFHVDEIAVAKLHDDRNRLRLLVLDPRTGKERWRRDFPPCRTGRLGTRLWLESPEDAPEPFVQLIDLPSGRDIPSGLVERGIRFSRCMASPDERYVATQNQGKVWVWNIEPGDELLAVEAERFAFSTDSSLLATLSVSRGGPSTPLLETWQIHDLSTGAVVAKAEAPSPVGRPPITEFTFFDRNQAVTCGHGSGDGYLEVDLWRWQDAGHPSEPIGVRSPAHNGSTNLAAQILTLRPASGRFRTPRSWYTDPIGAVAAVLVDDTQLIETATGRTLATLPAGFEVSKVSAGRRWAILRSVAPTYWEQFTGYVAIVSPRLAALLPEGRRGAVYDIATNRIVASLQTTEIPSAVFSEDGRDRDLSTPVPRWLATHDGETIRVRRLPPRAPWKEALAWSLIAPAAYIVRRAWITRSSRAFQ